MPRLDLHTHSAASPDGGLTAEDYGRLLAGNLDQLAVTDHDQITQAMALQKTYGKKIIVGEEITTSEGEIIGLFLTNLVAPGQSPHRTAQAIRRQGGLVYIPHPFETVRKGLSLSVLDRIADLVDIVEVYNGRAIQNRSTQALDWAQRHQKVTAASSDAHGRKGAGHTYTSTTELLTVKNWSAQLGKAKLVRGRPPLVSFSYPKINRLKKRLRRS